MDMDILLIKKEHPCQSDALLPPAYIPDDLIPEILSLLSVKTIMRFKSVSKSWNTLISDSTFVEQHLKNSSKNPHLVLTPGNIITDPMSSVVSFPVHRLLQNPSSTVSCNNFHGSMNKECQVIGSYDGLLCLLFSFKKHKKDSSYKFCLWNPATGTISIKVGTFKEQGCPSHFTFGCDISAGTYKVVATAKLPYYKNQVSVFSFVDNHWKNIQCFPDPFPLNFYKVDEGVHLNGTVNWLALSFCFDDYHSYLYFFNAKQSVIVSLDLSTETYTQILLPSDLDEKLYYFRPTLQVLMDCLCFSYHFKETELVIWQMKEFGFQESWTQLVRIDYCKIGFHYNWGSCNIYIISSSKNGDRLILTHYYLKDEIIIYSKRDMRVERIPVSNEVRWFSAMNYVESLVSTCWKSAIPTPSTFLIHNKERWE